MKKKTGKEEPLIVAYIIPFLAYLLTPLLFDTIGLGDYSYHARILMTGISLILYWKSYKLDFKKSKLGLSVIVGLLLFLLWLLIEKLMPYSSDFNPSNFNIAFKLLGGILIAPLVEELFTRKFFMRFMINPDKWDKIAPKFTLFSFIITAAFFGFSHNRWLAGLLVGAILNLLYIKTKKIESCVIAHSITNAVLAVCVVATGNWNFW